jgi:heat shock protein HslJ
MRKPRIGAIVALGALLGMLAGCGDGREPGSPPEAAPPQVGIVGSWRPVAIPGYKPPAQYPDAFANAPISFDRRQRLSGTDGCNAFEVSYHVARDGSFSSGEGPMTAIGCANVPNGPVTGQARHVTIAQDVLTFIDGKGRVLGVYQRIAPVGRPDVGPGPLARTLVGTWRPVRIAGYQPRPGYPDGLAQAPLTFTGSGTWRASDGCNLTAGTYVLGDGDRIAVTYGATTEIGCANVPNATALARASTVQVVRDRLTLRSAAGAVLAIYQRVR